RLHAHDLPGWYAANRAWRGLPQSGRQLDPGRLSVILLNEFLAALALARSELELDRRHGERRCDRRSAARISTRAADRSAIEADRGARTRHAARRERRRA